MPSSQPDAPTSKSLGVAACTAIVIGNMVGSGFYLSPAVLAPYGNLAILAWVIMGAGAICLGLTFAKLARLAPKTGGPYAYTRMAYGDFAGFLIAWGLWISMWSSLPVIAIAFAGAVIDLFPSMHNRAMAVVLTLAAIWAVVFVNLRGVKESGLFSQVTTYAKLIPFGAIALVGLFFIDTSNLSEFNPSGKSVLSSVAALAPATMFAFLGLESATIPAGDVIDPTRTIPRSTVLGITVAALLYVFGTMVVMGLVPREQLVHSVAPFRAGNRASCGLCRGGRPCPAIGSDRGDRLHLLRIHSLWVRSKARPLRHDHARARHSCLRLAATAPRVIASLVCHGTVPLSALGWTGRAPARRIAGASGRLRVAPPPKQTSLVVY
jgi:amino acid transporter